MPRPDVDELELSALEKWENLVYKRAKLVDPDDQHDWTSLAYGFFLALKFEPAKAYELALKAPG